MCIRDRYVATHFEKITHSEIFFQSALNLRPNQRTLKKFSKCVKFVTNLTNFEKKISKCVKSVHQHYFRCKLLTHFEKKNIDEVKLHALCFHLKDGISKCNNSLLN